MRRALPLALAGLLLAGVVVPLATSQAATPASSKAAVPASPGQTTTLRWTGTISPGVNPSSTCDGTETSPIDEHTVTLTAPPGGYTELTARFQFQIKWDNAENDEILTVVDSEGRDLGSSDGGAPEENVTLNDLKTGSYGVRACAFLSPTPQDYTGSLTITTAALAAAPRSVDAQGLSFSPTTPADPQRDESEPLIEIDRTGRMYTCGPTGTTGQAEYAQVSEDGGDQFHLLGQSPRGQLAAGGGGDCALALGPNRGPGERPRFAYTGLNALLTFSTARSDDGGQTLETSASNISIPGVDRQWMTFVDDETVLLSYNRLAPRSTVVQTSTNGGLTYGPPDPVAPNPTFPGPIRSFFGTPAGTGDRAGITYFTWSQGTTVNLALSRDRGRSWDNCQIVDAKVGPDAGFTSSDHDDAGNIYVSYAEEGAGNDTFLTMISFDRLSNCKTAEEVASGGVPGKNPGFITPVRVNRDRVETVVFPWVAAGGEPGRAAVAFYGTESIGDPNTGEFKASWDVYVNQSLSFTPTGRKEFSQVKATTHPFHYDSICLNGLGCALTVPAGDRSLADFFALDYNPVTKRLALVYNQGSKKPGEPEGHVATPAVLVQEGGPSNGGGTLTPRRPVVRTSSTDAEGDALVPYSQILAPPMAENRPALDVTKVEVLPERDLASGSAVENGGFNVRMTVGSLEEAELEDALLASQTNSLVYLFRFVNGFQAAGATARYSPVSGFSFAYDDYTTGSINCGSTGEKCIVYPGANEIPGKVDGNVLEMQVPRKFLRELVGSTGDQQRPSEREASAKARFYDATAFALGNPALNPADPGVVTFAYPADNAPSFDFILPAAQRSQEPTAEPTPPVIGGDCLSKGPGACPEDPQAGPAGPRLPATGASDAVLIWGLVLLVGGAFATRRFLRT